MAHARSISMGSHAAQEAVINGFQEHIIEQKPFSVELQRRSGCDRDPMQLLFKCARMHSAPAATTHVSAPMLQQHHSMLGWQTIHRCMHALHAGRRRRAPWILSRRT